MIRAVSLAFAIALLAAAPAAAEPVELTRQAKAAHTEFLLTATPPGPAATICLVDTGVNVNADTAGVIGRLAFTGEASDQSLTLHGTSMAMFIGAPSNGFGMVGIWPAAQDRQRPREHRRPGRVHRGQLHQRRQAMLQ